MSDTSSLESQHPPPGVPSTKRWNFGALILDVSCFTTGLAFLEPSAVLPLLLERLGASGVLIGALAASRSLIFNLIPVFIAYFLQKRVRLKPTLITVCNVTRLPVLILPYLIYHAADSPESQKIALWTTVVLLWFWSAGDGMGYAPWMEIVSRAFDERLRGRFFATTQLISGGINIGVAAFLVNPVLSATFLPYPANYAFLALMFGILMQASSVGLFLIKEPPAPVHAEPETTHLSLFTYLRSLPGAARGNPNFAKLLRVQLLLAAGTACQPFYVIYAKDYFHLTDDWGGKYQVLLAISGMGILPFIVYVTEKRGMASAIRFVGWVVLLTPIYAMTLGRLSPVMFGGVFLMMGGSLGWGLWMAVSQYLLADAPPAKRPLFIALMNLVSVPIALYPTLGGLLIRQTHFYSVAGVPILFVLTALVVSIGVYFISSLPERKPDAASR